MSEEISLAIGVPGLEPETRPNRLGAALLHLCAGLLGFFGPLVLLSNHGCCWSGQSQLTACKSNCKNIATALEMYSSDHHGLYPVTLEKLIQGNYLKVIPTCPSAGRVTYRYHASSQPDTFRFSCSGNNHARAYSGFSTSSNNYPLYYAEEGLIDHP